MILHFSVKDLNTSPATKPINLIKEEKKNKLIR
jgi:hypothetical protein